VQEIVRLLTPNVSISWGTDSPVAHSALFCRFWSSVSATAGRRCLPPGPRRCTGLSDAFKLREGPRMPARRHGAAPHEHRPARTKIRRQSQRLKPAADMGNLSAVQHGDARRPGLSGLS
jgi:hypothetical protein